MSFHFNLLAITHILAVNNDVYKIVRFLKYCLENCFSERKKKNNAK